MGKTNLIGGLICLAMTPLTGFLGVMMILEEPPAVGWAMIGLTVFMVIIAILAMRSRVRLVIDRSEDIVRLSHISPWRRTHEEVALSKTSGVVLVPDENPRSPNVAVVMAPAEGVEQPPLRVGYFATTGAAQAQAGHIRQWLDAAPTQV